MEVQKSQKGADDIITHLPDIRSSFHLQPIKQFFIEVLYPCFVHVLC